MTIPEILVVTLNSGDCAIFVNGDPIVQYEPADDDGVDIGEALSLIQSLGFAVPSSIDMPVPDDDEWDWSDVYRLIPKKLPTPTQHPGDLIIARLLDSEEHAGESAIPPIAEEAAELVRSLQDELDKLVEANQHLVSERDEALVRPGDELESRYVTEHPNYLRSDWAYEVENDDTQIGYWEWVYHRVESARD